MALKSTNIQHKLLITASIGAAVTVVGLVIKNRLSNKTKKVKKTSSSPPCTRVPSFNAIEQLTVENAILQRYLQQINQKLADLKAGKPVKDTV